MQASCYQLKIWSLPNYACNKHQTMLYTNNHQDRVQAENKKEKRKWLLGGLAVDGERVLGSVKSSGTVL